MSAHRLLRLLFLLLGSFYLNTVCQTDAEDARAYHARGIAEYVAAPVEVTVTAPVARRTSPRLRPVVARRGAQYQQRLAARPWPGPAPTPPRARRWLWCSVLQV
ncbi:hypothetical protein Q3A66_07190 [Hymenobacter sp. BT770]|uniref:hypothetical protein n=1 Tax=Hymenobacter sp. BT770 TaxID=2886942 RepID=UPI001D0F76E5|nr:hypothetical protein [Hymenobacter sp. BT770]MCC3152774.1 hypothetical protein [Hymenobacter sp. BT770]MDO3414849.1 hypothetical protein [Hymenobacter sp. BT770]